jgi:hypothetical protein
VLDEDLKIVKEMLILFIINESQATYFETAFVTCHVMRIGMCSQYVCTGQYEYYDESNLDEPKIEIWHTIKSSQSLLMIMEPT